MAFPFPPSREPHTLEDHVALLPPGLKEFVDREAAAGNPVAEAGTGHPAAPIGVWVKLTKGFQTVKQLPQAVTHRRRPGIGGWPAECFDPPRHFFVLSGPEPEAPAPLPTPLPAPIRPKHAKPIYVPPDVKPTFAYQDKIDEYAFLLRVSETIAAHAGLMWSKETEQAILNDVGKEGLTVVREIIEYANRPELWTRTPHDKAYTQIQTDLKSRYSFLSAAAIQRLSTAAAWGWR